MRNTHTYFGIPLLGLAARNLLRQRKRSALALTTVAGGVITLLLAGGFFNWILDSMRESTIHSQLGHLQITRPGYFEKGLSEPYSYLLPADVPAAARDDTDIVTISPRLAFTGLVSKGEETVSFAGEGIDPDQEAPITKAITVTTGRDLTEAPHRSALLGEGLAASLGADVGDTIVLLVTTGDRGINAIELTVCGHFRSVAKAYDDSVLRIPIDIARQLMRVDGATSWVVLLDETKDTDRMLDELQEVLDPTRFEVTPWHRLADFYNKTAELFSQQIGVVRLLIGMIVVLSISNTLSMTVIERTTEIGTVMAIGVRRAGVLGQFVVEGALLGVAGGTIGVLAGWIASVVISAIGIPMPPPPGMSSGYTGQISISPGIALDGFLLAFLTTLIASILPARKASRMNIVDALRCQR